MHMTEDEFRALCANKHLNAVVQVGRSAGTSYGVAEEKKETKKPPKYRNRKVYVHSSGLALYNKDKRYGGVVAIFDSEKEYHRYLELQGLERIGQITDLKRQVPFLIQEACERNGEKIAPINYKADFCYHRNGDSIVEDVKGFDVKKKKYMTTKDFDLKWKLLKYKYPELRFEIF